jgi:hypothetical protein
MQYIAAITDDMENLLSFKYVTLHVDRLRFDHKRTSYLEALSHGLNH